MREKLLALALVLLVGAFAGKIAVVSFPPGKSRVVLASAQPNRFNPAAATLQDRWAPLLLLDDDPRYDALFGAANRMVIESWKAQAQ